MSRILTLNLSSVTDSLGNAERSGILKVGEQSSEIIQSVGKIYAYDGTKKASWKGNRVGLPFNFPSVRQNSFRCSAIVVGSFTRAQSQFSGIHGRECWKRGLPIYTRTQQKKQSKLKKRRPIAPTAALTIDLVTSNNTVWAILLGCAAIGQFLENRTAIGSRMSAPLITILTAMFLSSLGIIPQASDVYDVVWTMIMPLSVALALLETDLRKAFSEAGDSMWAFWFGALGSIVGTVVAFAAVGGTLGPEGWKLASCLCATYIGGSINYAATAQALGIGSGGALAAGMAADNLLMALYFAVIMIIPNSWHSVVQTETVLQDDSTAQEGPTLTLSPPDPSASPDLSVESLSCSLAAAAMACLAASAVSVHLPPSCQGLQLGLTAVAASALSAIAAAVSTTHDVHVDLFVGAEKLGGTFMLLFFAVLGASAGISEALTAGASVFAFGFILLATHLCVILLLGRLAGLPLNTILIASNANVGGPATAAAMASTRKWDHLVQPALLTGTIGYTIGTAVGSLLGVYVLLPIGKAWLRL